MKNPAGNPESGYAMLLLFAMASIMAIMLYNALPRVAFEAQRDQEELLIERGEQYKRAIQVYYRKFKRYPAKIEDLDNTNQLRFLRHHYVDPITGKSEWRLIHIGPTGQLTDSLVQKPTKDKKEASVNNFITELQPIGGGNQPAGPPNAALRRRPSEGIQAGGAGENPAFPGGGQPPAFGQPGFGQPGSGQLGSGQPVSPPQPYPVVGVPGQPVPGQFFAGQFPQQQGQFPQQGQIAQPGQVPQQGPFPTGQFAGRGQIGQFPQQGQFPLGQSPQGQTPQQQVGIGGIATLPGPGSQIGYPGPPVNSQTGGVSPNPYYSTQPGAQGSFAPPFPQPGTSPTSGTNNNAATDVIRNLLTTPRPGGLAGTAPAGIGGQQIGGGLAGVASNSERGGIKIYNDQDQYNKWEFVYDFSKDKMNGGTIGVQPPQANPPLNGPGLNQPTGNQPTAPGSLPFNGIPQQGGTPPTGGIPPGYPGYQGPSQTGPLPAPR